MKILTKALTAGLIAASALSLGQGIQTTVNGQPVYFRDVQPMMIGGRVMVPLRGVFEHMGAHVEWQPVTRTVVVQSANDVIRLPIGSYDAIVDGQRVALDAPARIVHGRTMVPLRFTAEALDANVDWLAETRTVAITTTGVEARPNFPNDPRPINNPPRNNRTLLSLPANTVIPVRLDQKITSSNARVGQTFTATVDPPNDMEAYNGLPSGTRIKGRIHTAKPREGNNPGVLGFDFNQIILPNGRTHNMSGELIGLDNKSVETVNGRIEAKPEARNDDLKYVGWGAGAGLILAILGEGNALTNALLGGALGWLAGELLNQDRRPRDVNLDAGTRFGVRLDRDLEIRVPR